MSHFSYPIPVDDETKRDRMVDGRNGAVNDASNQSEDSRSVPVLLTPQPRHHRPTTSPSIHTSHAMLLHLQEYRERVHSACQSTYQFSLQLPKKPSQTHKLRSKGYCRSHVLETNKQFFHARDPGSSHFSTPVDIKDRVLPKKSEVYINFHQMRPRTDEYLLGDYASRRPRISDGTKNLTGVAKDHFALGPGQYEVTNIRPASTASVKFSPSDRFHENFSTDQPGPGQYNISDSLIRRHPVAAVFSQIPRQTEAAMLISPTANIVSSYYYVPKSGFADPKTTRIDHQTWSRTPRFATREDSRVTSRVNPSKESSVDHIERNKANIATQPVVQRLRNAHRSAAKEAKEESDTHHESVSPPPAMFKRRASIFVNALDQTPFSSPSSPQQHSQLCTVSECTRMPKIHSKYNETTDQTQGWTVLVTMVSFQLKVTKLYYLTVLIRKIRQAKTDHLKTLTFAEWKKLDKAYRTRYAKELIVKNVFRYLLILRIRRKTAHAQILRSFLTGLSVEVRFAIAMKKMKREIQTIQRWWRHVQLMIKAREEALYQKWVSVENRLRLEHINQMPHINRVFLSPTNRVTNSNTPSPSSSGGQSDQQLHKLLNLPDQTKWFTANFVLTSDGSLRGYDVDGGEGTVEVKNFRVYMREDGTQQDEEYFASEKQSSLLESNLSSSSSSSPKWKPYLMLFRQGAFRFVLLTSNSPLPSELQSWKDKLDRLAVSGSSSTRSSVSNGSFSISASSSSSCSSVDELVEASLQSGVLSGSLSSSSGTLSKRTSISVSPSSSCSLSGGRVGGNMSFISQTPSLRGKLQPSMRTFRQRQRMGVTVAEGELRYYVVDLLKDFPKVPTPLVWETIRQKLREKRRRFRAEIYRYKLEMYHYHQHKEQVKHIHVLDKFKEFFTLNRPRRPHFRSLISNRKMEALIRQTVEQVKMKSPSNPKYLLDSVKI